MLVITPGHEGEPVAPHDLLAGWHPEPAVLFGVAVVGALYAGGVRHTDSRRRRIAFATGLAAVVLALASPLDAAAASTATAHMVQHVALVLVAAPLLVVARPGAAIRRSLPRRANLMFGRAGRRIGAGRTARMETHPVFALLVVTGTFWWWHATGPYDAALRSDPIHALSHMSYLAAGIVLWRVVDGARAGPRSRHPNPPAAMGMLFAVALQGTLLAALMVFSSQPWYEAYVDTAPAWGMDAMTDQQLAGLVMWFSGAPVHLLAALWLLFGWLGMFAPEESGS